MLMTTFRQCVSRFLIGLVSALVISACRASDNGLCNAANEFRESVLQIGAGEALDFLDEDFWKSVKSEVDILADSTDGQLREGIIEAQNQLERLISHLEDVDYNVLAAITDPETADSFADTAAALTEIMVNEVDEVIRTSC